MANLYWPKRSQFRSRRRRRKRFEARIQEAEAAARKVLLVSHGHCLDGVGSAIMTLRAFGEQNVGVVYAQPSDMSRVLDHIARIPALGRTLMITDLSLDPDDFDSIVASCRRIKEQGWRIEWRDHHHKQWEGLDLDRLTEHLDVLEVDTKAKESGASLQQQAVCPKDRFAKRLAETIRDRDLWWNKTPDSETLEFAITWMGEDAFTRHFLARGGKEPVVDDVIQDAADAERAEVERRSERILSGAKIYGDGDCKVAVVYGWLPKNVGLHRMLQQDGVQVAINVRPNGNVSLRSRKDAPVCQAVAKRFKGGGHPNASGATLSLAGLPYWWYVLRRGRIGKVRDMAEIALQELRGD